MNLEILDKIINLPISIFGEFEWDDYDFDELNKQIQFINDNFNNELENNLFGQTHLIKIDIVRNYVISISYIIENIFVDYSNISSKFKDRDIVYPNLTAINKIKDCYLHIIDMISFICINSSIDLEMIVSQNHVACGRFDLSSYNTMVNESVLKKGKIEIKLKNSFINDGYRFFTFLIENFSKKYSDQNKFSVIYWLMLKDKFIDEDMRPEIFKKYISRSPYNASLNFSLYDKTKLGKRVTEHYYELKLKFFEI